MNETGSADFIVLSVRPNRWQFPLSSDGNKTKI